MEPQQSSFYQLVERFYPEFEAVYEERYQERYGFWRPSRRDPSSGAIPTAYLILNVTTGHIKRHTGGYVWEIPAA